MSKKLPNINYEDNQGEYNFKNPYSEATARLIDEEVLEIINTQYERAKQILRDHREGHLEVAKLLYTREVILAEDVELILGKRPWVSRADELMKDAEEDHTARAEEESPLTAETEVRNSNDPQEDSHDKE